MDNNWIWTIIKEYPDYIISNYGVVVSFKKIKPKILKPEIDRDGYRMITLGNNEGFKRFRVAQLVLETFREKKPTKNHISRHKDDNPSNNYIENLEWGTVLDNIKDRDIRNRTCKGSKQHLSRFKEEDILVIKNMIRQGKTDKEICNIYNVNGGTIWFIRNNITWKHV